MVEVLLYVVQSLQDAQNGLAHIGEHLQDETLRRYFLAESLKRANFRAELENELHRVGLADVRVAVSLGGTLHRIWGDIKAMAGADDQSLLRTAEHGEEIARHAYEDALEEDLPSPVRHLLAEQQAHVNSSHDYVCQNLISSGEVTEA
ncbi:MAG: PA2169 family four-helix-bundle protein [Acidobacteriaceae bacterium]|nr:PA2169 family four-helix-bundle protein [Acidobacteriaceae bacterium]